MHRILFTIAGHEISSYSFFTVLSFIIVTFGLYFYGQKRGFSRSILYKVIPLLAFSAIIGARFLHALINFSLYQSEPWRLWYFGFSGFSIYGGLLGAVFCAIVCARIWHLNIWRLGDTTAPFLGLGIVSMRIGCYLNGCCFGHETDLPWGVVFPFFSQAHSYQLTKDPSHLFYVSPVHPTQLYEIGYAFLGVIVAYFLIKKMQKAWHIPDGWPVLAFGIIYTFGRLINIHFRVQPPTVDVSNLFYPALYLCSIVIMISLAWWQKNKLNNITI